MKNWIMYIKGIYKKSVQNLNWKQTKLSTIINYPEPYIMKFFMFMHNLG